MSESEDVTVTSAQVTVQEGEGMGYVPFSGIWYNSNKGPLMEFTLVKGEEWPPARTGSVWFLVRETKHAKPKSQGVRRESASEESVETSTDSAQAELPL